jgi:hypothetical protein
LNYAIDLRSKIQTRQWENTKTLVVNFFKGALVIVAIMFGLWIGAGIIPRFESVVCNRCGGDGLIGEKWFDGIPQQTCPKCNGSGTVTKRKN